MKKGNYSKYLIVISVNCFLKTVFLKQPEFQIVKATIGKWWQFPKSNKRDAQKDVTWIQENEIMWAVDLERDFDHFVKHPSKWLRETY